MSERSMTATRALRLCSDMKGRLMGALFCYGGERGLPHDPAMFIYFILCSACWVKKRSKAQEAMARWWGTPQLHTCTHRVSSVLLWNRKHSWLHKGPFHQSSYRIWQPLQSLSLPVLSVVPFFFSAKFFPVFLSFSNLHKSILDPSSWGATSKHTGNVNLELDCQIKKITLALT